MIAGRSRYDSAVVSDVETLPDSSRKTWVVSTGAAATARTVAVPSSTSAAVNNRRTKASPPSGSSRSARTSTGTTIEVRTAPSTSSEIMLGIWCATVNDDATLAPSRVRISSCLRKPVMRLTRVATAMEPVAASRLCGFLRPDATPVMSGEVVGESDGPGFGCVSTSSRVEFPVISHTLRRLDPALPGTGAEVVCPPGTAGVLPHIP